MAISDIAKTLTAYGQEHLLEFYKGLQPAEQEAFLAQVEKIDWSVLDNLHSHSDFSGKGEIQPLSGLRIPEIEKKKQEFFEIGKQALQKDEVCAVILAGGMATRLGLNGPKGLYDIGVTRTLYIFEQLFENIKDVNRACDCTVPVAIMTSESNDEPTKAFFAEQNYFGYPAEKVFFFRQEMAPCVDFDGKAFTDGKLVATSPNGNGGWFSSLVRSGVMDQLEKIGVQWLNVVAVDNVLQRICDPVFVGATIQANVNCGAKVVVKVAPEEKVGVLCLKNGRPDIVEYYEMDKETSEERDEEGNLKFSFGVILNYLFRLPRLKETLGEKIPVHVVRKKITRKDKEGNKLTPDKENGFKFETLVVDMIALMQTCLPFEVDRNKEFAPIKNASGTDSVETARKLLELNGVKL